MWQVLIQEGQSRRGKLSGNSGSGFCAIAGSILLCRLVSNPASEILGVHESSETQALPKLLAANRQLYTFSARYRCSGTDFRF